MSENEESAADSANVGPQPQAQKQSTASSDSRRKSPFLACLLSLMPGLGQVYVGYYQRGFVNCLVVGFVIAFLAVQDDFTPLIPIAGIFLAFYWLYNVIDAGRRAALYNEMLDGRTDIELPQDFKVAGLQGSVGGGATLVAVGFILLMHTRFDFSLDWLEEWWPVGLMLFGAFLIYKAKQGESAASASRGWEPEEE